MACIACFKIQLLAVLSIVYAAVVLAQAEMEESKHSHDAGGIVSLIVKDTRQK